MATIKLTMTLFTGLLAALASSISATDFIVGDEYGWTLDFDYQAWAKGKTFVVGDRIVFKYEVGKHNVFKVDGYMFKKCIVPPANWSLASGNDVITLATPGRKWYICGVGEHCEKRGMKLVIDVFPQRLAPTPRVAPGARAPFPIPIIPVEPIAPAPHVAPIAFAPFPIPVGPVGPAGPAPLPFGKVFMVGDYSGWTLDFDYAAWAMEKEFFVGDILVFKYTKGAHNVIKVNGTDFQQCTIPVSSVPLTSGYDMVLLKTPGKKWYICGVETHCKTRDMKLVINVLPRPWSSPPLSPSSSYDGARRLGNN